MDPMEDLDPMEIILSHQGMISRLIDLAIAPVRSFRLFDLPSEILQTFFSMALLFSCSTNFGMAAYHR